MSNSLQVDQSLRIAIVNQLNSLGGVQSCCISLIKGLNHKEITPDIIWDVEPDWLLLRNAGVIAKYRPLGFPFPTPLLENIPATFRYLLQIGNTINGDQFQDRYDFFYIFFNGFLVPQEIPHVRYLSGPPLLPQLDGISSGLRGIPFRTFRWLYQNILHKVKPAYEFHKASNYVINSKFTADLFHEAHGVNLRVVHPPIDFSGRSFDFGDLQRRDTLTFFSRFVDYKRPEMILELAALHNNLRCVLMGSVIPSQREYFCTLKTIAEKLNIRNITFLDNPSNQRVKEELSRTLFFVFPAINEHFGMVTPEAIASGVIPFVHDSGGQKEIVPDSRLRFSDSNFIEKFDALTKMTVAELNQIRQDLNEHIQQYTEDVYINEMLSFIAEDSEAMQQAPSTAHQKHNKISW